MRVAGLALLALLAACASAMDAGSATVAAQPWEREPFTRTSQIEIDGDRVGYLVEYEPTPSGTSVERALPVGSYRIQARDFEDVGFISPRGEVRRYAGGGSVSLGYWSLEEGLIVFFGGGRRARLMLLETARPPPASAPDAGKAPEAEPASESADAGSSGTR